MENLARVDAGELPELLAKMEDYNGDVITRLAMKLMAYTFVSTSEEIEAPWTEFNLVTHYGCLSNFAQTLTGLASILSYICKLLILR